MLKLKIFFLLGAILLFGLYSTKSYAQQKSETSMPSRLKLTKIHPTDLIDNDYTSTSLQYAIERMDNDYVTYKDTESPRSETPKSVIKKTRSILNSSQLPFSEKDCSLFKINIDSNFQAFVLVANFSSYQKGYIILYNIQDEITSHTPIEVNLKWATNNEQGFDYKILKYPLVEIKKEGISYKMYLKERVHNGNMYNAVLTKVYNLDKTNSLQLLCCYESYSFINENTYIERVLKDSIISVFKNTVTSKEYLGSIVLSDNNSKINTINCLDESYCDMIFTNSGRNPNEMLKNGYFSY